MSVHKACIELAVLSEDKEAVERLAAADCSVSRADDVPTDDSSRDRRDSGSARDASPAVGRARRIVPLPFPEQGLRLNMSANTITHPDGRTEPYSDSRWAGLTREYLLTLGHMDDDDTPVWDERPHWAYVRYQCMRCFFIWQSSDEEMGGDEVPHDECGNIICPFCEPDRMAKVPWRRLHLVLGGDELGRRLSASDA